MDLDPDADQKLCDAAAAACPGVWIADQFPTDGGGVFWDATYGTDDPSERFSVADSCSEAVARWLVMCHDNFQRYIACVREQKQTIAEQADSIRDGAVRETSERRRADKAEQRILDALVARAEAEDESSALRCKVAELEAELAALKSRDASAEARLNELLLSEAAGRRANEALKGTNSGKED